MYRERIEKLAPGYDPAHVEGYMLRYSGRLPEAMDDDEFEDQIEFAIMCIKEDGLEAADREARTQGLRPKKRTS